MKTIGVKVIFIEVTNNDEKFLAENYRTTVQYSADYAGRCDVLSVSN